MLCIRDSLSNSVLPCSSKTESVFCKLTQKNKPPTIVGCIYRPPWTKNDYAQQVRQELLDLRTKFPKSNFILGGDFNLPDINWTTESVDGHRYCRNINDTFMDAFHDLGLKQIVDTHTRGKSTLDLFLTTNPNLVVDHSVISGISDHDIVDVQMRINLPRKKPIKRKIFLWNRTNIDQIRKDARNLNHLFTSRHKNDNNVDNIWNCLKRSLLLLLDDNVASKITSSKHHQPWITTATKRIVRQKQRWYTKSKQKTDCPITQQKYKDMKKDSQRLCRKTHDTYVNNLIEDDTNNKKLFTYIRSKNQENVGISDIFNGNTLIQDPKTKAELFNIQFSSVFSTPGPLLNSSTTTNSSSFPCMPNIKVSRPGVLKLLLNINEHKATGPDEIPGRLLKICANELADSFTLLFQTSLNQGSIPSDWRKARIVPVFKKGDKGKVENYRPISLVSISCKILEHIVHSSIMDHLDKLNYLNDAQHGFRQRRSCESQLITTLRDFSNCLNDHKQIDAILLDFSKAFDKVDHRLLLSKLHQAGIRNSLLSWMESFLLNRTQTVAVDGIESSPSPVLSGVPQGTTLGPLLFLIYINDISKNLSPNTKIRLFADDSLLYRTISSPSDSAQLQKDLDTLQLWETSNKMEFHPGKCLTLRITNKQKPILSDYFIHSTKLSLTDSAKYLGVTIDSKLSWSAHINNIQSKANSTLAFLRRNLHSCPRPVKETCYKTFVRPILEYGGCVWDPHQQNQIDQIERVQKRAARFVTGNHELIHGNTEKNMKSLGWDSLEERRARSKLTTLYKARTGAISIPIEDLIISNTRTRQSSNYFIPYSSVNSHLHSFYPSTIRLWNSIPPDTQSAVSIESFKGSIGKIITKPSPSPPLVCLLTTTVFNCT